jgi:hypothetical protein
MTGSIAGVVQDSQGGLVAGANVMARETGTGARTATSSSGEGFYRLANLIPGEYLIEVTAPGFRTASLPVGRVGAGEAVRLDAALQLGEVTESVTVEAAATQVTTDEAQLRRTIREIPLLPLLSGSAGRNPLALLAITPGVSTYIATSQPGNFSVNGQRVYANNFVLDGGNASLQVTGPRKPRWRGSRRTPWRSCAW